MVIHEMTLEECREVLAQATLARLACDMDGQPYVVPVYLAYDGSSLFGFATMGYKIDCMRANSLVCVEVDDIKSQNHWMTVVVSGTYEELPDTEEYTAARAHAHELLQRRAMWWEPACVAVEHRDYPKSFTPIFYRIHVDRMTGRRASPDLVGVQPARQAKSPSWLGRLLDRVLLK
ncbi:MAG TPA: pyridoxamine 5'-phosphate oxidase family protein [Blastocatellia bacterium]|nr:pyridoxamine 5'-phosphate oxidase family protein [Blastocatellia bacterium]